MSDPALVEYCNEFFERTKIVNTQAIVFRHLDKPHPHVHIVVNRVDCNGRMIAALNDIESICLRMNLVHGFSEGQDRRFMAEIEPLDFSKIAKPQICFFLMNSIAEAMSTIDNIDKLPEQLLMNGTGITVDYHMSEDNQKRDGILFSKTYVDIHGTMKYFTFSGSTIDRMMSINNLE